MPIRFHLDENVDHVVADALRRRGLDVTTASDANLIGASDLDHLQFAFREGRILFKHDVDFLRIAKSGVTHAGIAYCHQKDRSISGMILGLVALSRYQTGEELRGRVHFI